MKDRGYFFGFLLVFIGLVWILENLNLINFSLWSSIYNLWPLLLIVLGLNIVFKNNKFVKLLSWILFFASLLVYGIIQQNNFSVYEDINNHNFLLENKQEIETANLDLDIGTGFLNISSEDTSLVKGYISDPKVKNKVSYKNQNKIANIYLQNTTPFSTNRFKDKYYLELNKTIDWNLYLDAGVIKGDLDFSDLNISDLDLNVGISDIKIVFGTKSEYLKANIDTGISNVELVLPENTGVKIIFEGAITNTNLKKLNWIRNNNSYKTPNYDDSNDKIDIYVRMGIGNLNVVTK